MVIGAFIAQLDDAYQRSVWQGISNRARETGHGLVCFIGQRLDAPATAEASRNIAYRMARHDTIDGLIVLSTTISTFLGLPGVQKILENKDIPQVSVGLPIPGLANVLVDSAPAMTELVQHVLRRHGKRRIALLAGPTGHKEADEREAVFREVMHQEGVTFDERLLVRGSFLRPSGCEAARQLLAQGIPFDALICLNDRMALGAMEELREAGLTIPADVMVTGFDDIGEARWESPPLTTVSQPLEQLGSAAVDMILDLLAGRTPANRVLDCSLVIRQSCGCPPLRSLPLALENEDLEQDPAERAIVAALSDFALRGEAEAFLQLLNGALLEASNDAPALAQWRRKLQAIRLRCHPDPISTPLMHLYSEALVLIGEAESRHQAAARIASEEQQFLMRELSAQLAGAFGMAPMLAHLAQGLERLRIRYGFLALFDGPVQAGGKTVPPGSRLIMAHLPSGEPYHMDPTVVFPSIQLLPHGMTGLIKGGEWVLEPLVYHDEPLGYLLLEGGIRDPSVYETLRDQISSTLKGSLLMEQIQHHEHDLETQVSSRTQELRQANQDLLVHIEQRRILEGQVQEISNRTMQAIGQDLHDDLCQHLAGISMFVSVIEGKLAESGEVSLPAVRQVRELLEGAVARSRQIARGLYPPGLKERGLVTALEDLVESMARKQSVRVSFEAGEDCRLPSARQSLQLYRIVQESLSNALRHSGSDLVMVRLFREAGALVAEVRDFGSGLPAQPKGNGMGLRIMRYRAESIGAQLNFSYLDPGLCVSCRIKDGEAEGA